MTSPRDALPRQMSVEITKLTVVMRTPAFVLEFVERRAEVWPVEPASRGVTHVRLEVGAASCTVALLHSWIRNCNAVVQLDP